MAKRLLQKNRLINSGVLLVTLLAACVPFEAGGEDGGNITQTAAVYATVGDTGLATSNAGSNEAAVQAAEAEALQSVYKGLAESGFVTAEDWEAGAATVSETLRFVPMTHAEMVDRSNVEIEDGEYTEPPPLTVEAALAEQEAAAEDFSTRLLEDLPGFTDEQLTSLRIKLTVALAVLETQRNHNTAPDALDEQFLDLAKSTNQSLRSAAIDEMRRRGLIE